MGPELLDQSAGRSGGKERRQPVLGRAGQYLFLGRSIKASRRRYNDTGPAVRGSSRSQPLRQVRERGVQSAVVGLSVSKQSPRPLVERADAGFGRYVARVIRDWGAAASPGLGPLCRRKRKYDATPLQGLFEA